MTEQPPPPGVTWNGSAWVAADGSVWDGQRWIAPPPTPSVPMPRQPVRKPPGKVTGWMNRHPIWSVLIILVIVGTFGLASVWSAGKKELNTFTEAAPVDTYVAFPDRPDTSWIPAGFHNDFDEDVAWRWHDSKGLDCGYDDACAAIDVIAGPSGCSRGVFVEMAEVDDSGTLLNPTNEIGPGLAPGDKALITVGWYKDEATGSQVRVTDMSCMG